MGDPVEKDRTIDVFIVSVLNVGLVPSYVRSVLFKAIVDGKIMSFQTLDFNNRIMSMLNPKPSTAVEPGRKLTYYYPLDVLREMKKPAKEVFLVEVIVSDEIGNEYRAPISGYLQSTIFG